jgi:hypothetical protein
MNNDEYSRRYGQAAKTAVACCVARSRWARPIYPSTYTNKKSSRAAQQLQLQLLAGWLAGSRKAHAPIIIAGSLRGPHARFGWRRRPIRSTEDPVHATPRHLLPPLTSRRRRIPPPPRPPSRPPAAAFSGGPAASRETWGPAAVLARVVSPWGVCLGPVRRVRAL